MSSRTRARTSLRTRTVRPNFSTRPSWLPRGGRRSLMPSATSKGHKGASLKKKESVSCTESEETGVIGEGPSMVAESEILKEEACHPKPQAETEDRPKNRPSDISLKETIETGRALEMKEAVQKLQHAAERNISQWTMYKSGIVRIEVGGTYVCDLSPELVLCGKVGLPGGESALNWLKHQTSLMQRYMSFYFRQRDESICDLQQESIEDSSVFCGIGNSWLWKGIEGDHLDGGLFECIHRFLDPQNPSIKCVGATRFDCDRSIDEEWKEFGTYLFFIPAVEYFEDPGQSTLACTLAWDAADVSVRGPYHGSGASTPTEAVKLVCDILQDIAPVTSHTTLAPHVQWMSETPTPSPDDWNKLMAETSSTLKTIKHMGSLSGGIDSETATREYLESGQQGLDDLLMSLRMSTEIEEQNDINANEELAKLVLARRTELEISGTLNPHSMLQHLQNCDPYAYQFCLGMPQGWTFIGSTPERLYMRKGDQVISEAIAGTRPRGPKGNLQQDFLIGLEMMRHPKDHVEFTLVRDWLTDTLHTICSNVDIDVHKSVIRRATVQHLYSRLRGRLRDFQSDFDILKALHPTPAVCGHPQKMAKEILAEKESFDRGYYAGPLGWLSGQGAEFVVAIRSGLFKNKGKGEHVLSLFAGVGTVKGSDAEAEWKELDLKLRPFKQLLSTRIPFLSTANANIKTASLLVEELCRSGIHTFAVAPGSRSSPLVYAVATNPNCHIFPCIDERSLGFWSLGYARATHRPAPIITSSGTAVGNLMPSVIEASLSRVPMLLLTADRPSNLRKTGANQTIDQVKIFGDYVRYFHDIPPPSEEDPSSVSRALLTTVDAAVRHACVDPAGPVHLNFQFNEPLSPTQRKAEQKEKKDHILDRWLTSDQCFTRALPGTLILRDHQLLLDQMQHANRGLMIVGELLMPIEQTAAAEIANLLQWPCIVDILSGLKTPFYDMNSSHIHTADQILSRDASVWETLRPDVILQFGGHLTSKRLMQFLEHCREVHPSMEWIQVSSDSWRDDPYHLVTEKVTVSLPQLRHLLRLGSWKSQTNDNSYLHQWKSADQSVARSLAQSLSYLAHREDMTEPYVSFLLSQLLPEGHGLFLGNGMPIRDMEMFGGVALRRGVSAKESPISMVAANRGASGIDGIVSAAIGYAVGLRKPVTLLIGDVSFLHDSNGLNFLRSETWPPIALVVINNGGGGIFDFLPIANAVPPDMFDALWSTPQSVNIAVLCQAYGVAHSLVTKPAEFEEALKSAWKSHQHCVVEVATNRKNNVTLHRQIQAISSAAAVRAVNLYKTTTQSSKAVIEYLSWHHFSLPLQKGATTGSLAQSRNGILLRITLRSETGEWSGIGEISPLEGLHAQSLQDVLPQLQYLRRMLTGQEIPREICLLNGNLSDWLSDTYGIEGSDLSPSVRFGLETALLMSFACMEDHPLHKVWVPRADEGQRISVNALLEDVLSQEVAVERCRDFLRQGYRTVKVKVGRSHFPQAEAEVINIIASTFGDQLGIRIDANRAWSIDSALDFAKHLSCTTLEYIEEPVNKLSDMALFCEKTQLPVVLDESIISCESASDVAELLVSLPGVVGCVFKPSCVGSVDRLMQMMELCASLNRKAVISSAFESPVGISLLCELAAMSNAIMQRNSGTCAESVSHGLGTVEWFPPDPSSTCLRIPSISLDASWQLLLSQSQKFEPESYCVEETESRQSVCTDAGEYVFHYYEVKESSQKPMVLFLHGFLGNSQEWLPIMHYLSHAFVCVAVDIPAHGETHVHPREPFSDADMYDFDRVSEALQSFIYLLDEMPHGIVGYSLGGRLAQHMALHMSCPKLIVISGTPGMEDPIKRAVRLQQDIETADILASSLPYERFLQRWYAGSQLWSQLRQRHPMFMHLLQKRQKGARPKELAEALVGMSTAKMEPLMHPLSASMVDVLYVYGQEDAKFSGLMESLDRRFGNRFAFLPFRFRGHGLLVESGLRLGTTIFKFL